MFDYNDVGVDMGMDVWVCTVIKVLLVDRRIFFMMVQAPGNLEKMTKTSGDNTKHKIQH